MILGTDKQLADEVVDKLLFSEISPERAARLSRLDRLYAVHGLVFHVHLFT